MAPSSGELWGHHLMPQMIVVDCLMPNGVIVPLKSFRETPLHKIKEELWEEAKSYPLFHTLQDRKSYIFVSVTQDAEKEEFYDENRRLCDLRLFQAVLKLVEPEGNVEEKMLAYDIGIALGVHLHDFDEIKEDEVVVWRRHLLELTQKTCLARDKDGKESHSLYAYPPEIENSPHLPKSMEAKLDKGQVRVAVWSLAENKEKQKFTVAVHHKDTPEQIVREAIFKKIRHSDVYRSQEEKRRIVQEFQSSYVLKAAGSDQYFLLQCPISQYKYIRSHVAQSKVPDLMLMSRRGVYSSLPEINFHMPSYSREPLPDVSDKDSTTLWRLDSPFELQVLSATYVNVKEADQIYVRVGVYHGTDSICQVRQTEHVSHAHPRWDQTVKFESLFNLDLPRAAKLCLSICAVKRRKNGRDETTMLCWGNLSLFDWRGRLLTGKHSLNLWSVPRGMDELLNPLGCVGSNPVKDSPCLELHFEKHPQHNLILFPTMKEYRQYAKFAESLCADSSSNYNVVFDKPQERISSSERQQLIDISKRDPLAEISEQEKVTLWRLRKHCREIPDILPRFLDAVKWNCRDDVTQLYLLLEDWPMVTPQTALELLDCKYADPFVREMAVKWLNEMSDEDLAQFLLQLVQTLKCEPYLQNPLSDLLLKRALLNKKVGHFFFWHLKSELLAPSLTVKFGLLLEAFCRGLGPHLKKLIRQVDANDKMTKLSDSMKERLPESVKERGKYMFEQLSQADYVESLQCINSPLDNTILLGDLELDQCKVMDSAKKPLWLVWRNPDLLAERLNMFNAIIFKNGDDLRQDMLTLQVISIMDHIWHMEGLDLRMTPYTCLSTGHQVGMIQVVKNAKTVYQIQRKASRLAAIQVDSTQLFKWIKENNRSNLQQAIDTFTLSCAGYCVATFIMGIGDRHPDNIMVSEEGQIFHIDFGHFLGHFKKKFGISRERVPFILTDDFLLVISKGKDNPKKSEEFAHFQELCGKAYLALRRHSNILITMFMMMLQTGIPELQNINDVGYLRQTLAVEKTDQEALEYFQSMFYDAYGGAWTTKLDWFFHSVRHGV